MLTGDQLFAARTSAGMTQQELANVVGATQRSVGNWERADRVPRAAEQRVRTALAAYLGEDQPIGMALSEVSDARLLAEIARRFDRAREDGEHGGDTAPTKGGPQGPVDGDSQAPGSGATVHELPSAEALDPTIPEDFAARSHQGKGKSEAARERQDEEGES